MDKLNLLIEIHGGLGDQICAEPVIRFIKNKWPNYEISIITHYPELFAHLDIKAYDKDTHFTEPHLKACTHPPNDHFLSKIIDFQQLHTVDFISICLLKMTLDPLDKQIIIKVPEETDLKVSELIGKNLNNILVHPGMSWQSKTFPKEYWQSYIDILVNAGYKVIIVGKDFGENKGIVQGLDTSKCLNLVNKLSIMELCAALKQCPILISNDSGLIHLSGAFNNIVGVISTVRRPNTLFHWRQGIQGLNYFSLENYPLYNDLIPDTIAGHYTYNSHLKEEDILKALPDADKILEFVDHHI